MQRNLLPTIFLFAFALIAPRALYAGDETTPVHADTSKAWLLHLPGIAGETGMDRAFLRGLKLGGYDGVAELYDWTGDDPGIPALTNRTRNNAEAKKIAE